MPDNALADTNVRCIKPIHAPDSPIAEAIRSCCRIARGEATVLLSGETGTGKEVFARLIHEQSARAKGPFVAINCGAIPETLLESELFGYVKGAFTGADKARRGRVAMADGGTLFLDEIGELPLSLQVKLLRVLQERVYEPVGSPESVPANFRLIAATHRDLASEVEAGRFRKDLYYRLFVCPIELPALRERKCDILPLFRHFWAARGERRPIEPAVLEAFERYGWPGNVRELENLVERLSVCSEGEAITVADLPPNIRSLARGEEVGSPSAKQAESAVMLELVRPAEDADPPLPQPSPAAVSTSFPVDLPGLLRSLEEAYIEAALKQAKGNRKAAADMLGLQRTTLVEKLRRRAKAVAHLPLAPAAGEACANLTPQCA